jgi:hypothetical protein
MRRSTFPEVVRGICDRLVGSPAFPCKYPECSCTEEDKAVRLGRKRVEEALAAEDEFNSQQRRQT